MLLAEKGGRASWGPLRALARQQDDERLALRGLWALNVTGGLDDDLAAEMLKHKGEHVRAWTVRLLGDAKGVSPSIAKRLAELAATDPSPIVRAQLLCTAKRLPGEQALPIIERSLGRDADANDPAIPWLLWWAIESHAMTERERMTAFFTKAENRTSAAVRANLGRLIRRYAADGTAAGYNAAHALLAATPGDEPPATSGRPRSRARGAVGRLAAGGAGGALRQTREPGHGTNPAREEVRTADDRAGRVHSRGLDRCTDERHRHATRASGRHRLGPGTGPC